MNEMKNVDTQVVIFFILAKHLLFKMESRDVKENFHGEKLAVIIFFYITKDNDFRMEC